MMDILPVIVLYDRTLEESETYRTLGPQLRERTCPLVVYDNSLHASPLPTNSGIALIHHHNAENGGIAAAYNFALGTALDRRVGWLLLLDQDSEFPDDYLTAVEQAIAKYSAMSSVVAVVPRAWCKNRLISPNLVSYGRHIPLHSEVEGICRHEVTAINSGAIMRTDFLLQIGGFSSSYHLDCVDRWLFRRVYSVNKAVVILPINIKHNLSVFNYRTHISFERYRSILTAETCFTLSEQSLLEAVIYVARLWIRAVKFLLLLQNPRMAFLTLGESASVFLRIVTGRRKLSYSRQQYV